MLSESQAWRKLRSRSGNRHRIRHDVEYKKYLTSKNGGSFCAHSTTSICPTSGSPASLLTDPIKQAQHQQQSQPTEPAHKVRFNPVVRVCLVPCRTDFRGDFDLLFWEKEDYQAFKEDALQELRAHWMKHNTSVKEAIFALYQPSKADEAIAKGMSPPLLTHVDSMGVMAHFKQAANEAGPVLPSQSTSTPGQITHTSTAAVSGGEENAAPIEIESAVLVGDITDSEEGDSHRSSANHSDSVDSAAASSSSPTAGLPIDPSSSSSSRGGSRAGGSANAGTGAGADDGLVLPASVSSSPQLSIDGRAITGVLAAAVVGSDVTPLHRSQSGEDREQGRREEEGEEGDPPPPPASPSPLSSPVGAADILVDDTALSVPLAPAKGSNLSLVLARLDSKERDREKEREASSASLANSAHSGSAASLQSLGGGGGGSGGSGSPAGGLRLLLMEEAAPAQTSAPAPASTSAPGPGPSAGPRSNASSFESPILTC